MTFEQLVQKVKERFAYLQTVSNTLFNVNVSGENLWKAYINNFAPEDNPVFRNPESSTYNCNIDRQFIERYGNIVAINSNNELVTLWDLELEPGNMFFDPCAAMHNLVLEGLVTDIFVQDLPFLVETNKEPVSYTTSSMFRTNKDKFFKQYKEEETFNGRVKAGKIYTFNFFNLELPKKFVKETAKQANEYRNEITSRIQVFKRLLDEVSIDTLKLVSDLASQGSLLRTEDKLGIFDSLIKFSEDYKKASNQNNFIFRVGSDIPDAIGKIRNTSLGTLIVDLAEGMEINQAVEKYNRMVDPINYKKAVAPITKTQKDLAIAEIKKLGYEDAFNRRMATLDDIHVAFINHLNNVGEEVKKASIFDTVKVAPSTRHKKSEFEKVETISIDKFMTDVLPGCTSVELYVEPQFLNKNLVALHTAQTDKHPFQWKNPFAWTYIGNLSGISNIAENVKKAGGEINSLFRCSLQWNDKDTPAIVDFDLHCRFNYRLSTYPASEIINFRGKVGAHSNLNLDVDMINPTNVGIENIYLPKTSVLKNGEYVFQVHNFNGRFNTGFKVELSTPTETFSYLVNGNAQGYTDIAKVTVFDGQFTFQHYQKPVETTYSQVEAWGVKSNEFKKVKLLCLSPNYWETNVGVKNYFFMLEGCTPTEPIRGFHSDMLNSELNKQPTRRFIDIFGSFYQINEFPHNGLAGLGFDTTRQTDFVLKLEGSHKRIVRVNI